MAEFVGTYKFEKDDGRFDEFLKAMSVSCVIREIALSITPTIEISMKDDDTVLVKTMSKFKNTEIEFKLGREFEEKRLDGMTCRSVIDKLENKLIHKQTADPPVEIVRVFTDDKMIATYKCGDVGCVREYKKI